jgi:hypothetical protein
LFREDVLVVNVAGWENMETAEGLLRSGLTETTAGDGSDLLMDITLLLGVRGVEGVVGVVGAEPGVEFGIISFKITCFDPDEGLCPDFAAAVIIVCRN